jgi:hypothetical protein
MSYQTNDIVIDLRQSEQEKQQSILKFVGCILLQMIRDSADGVEFSLADTVPEAKFQISCFIKNQKYYPGFPK